MAGQTEAPFRAQDVQEVAAMVRGLEANKGKGQGDKFSCKKHTYKVPGTDIAVDSWKMQDWDYKKPNLPTYARGLFTTKTKAGHPMIAVRGYDKFFNNNEVRETEWANIERDTRGPYELSVKENGCIIFISGLEDGSLIVCSKHSTGSTHAETGTRWVERHLASVGKSKADLARTLREMNATAVAELCDDDFEEHVLEYGPDAAGLYLHGINLNLPEFATYPHHLVDKFADDWGFKKTMYIMKETVQEVKTFLDGIAETGHYAGRDTEGFVVRCQSKANTNEWHNWFFKYKFEEPYLMYRQWRECTKAMIAGREPKYKKHKKITEDYLLFARKQLHGNRALGEAYMQNHGIIKLRDDFLASRGLKGYEIIQQEAAEGEFTDESVSTDVVLVPVATLGCGKTTLALALCKLFGWGHIQNDNITVKKGKPQAFANACTRTLTDYPVVVADRNNHQRREREQIIHDIKRVVQNARVVALHFVHDRSNYDAIRHNLRQRILARGDNHQTIHTSKGEGEIIGIMEGFLHRFEPLNPESAPDDEFDLVINLDPTVPSRENLEKVINALYAQYPKLFAEKQMPSAGEMDAAIHAALNDYTVDVKHDLKFREDKHTKAAKQAVQQQNNGATKPKAPKIEYFGVQVPLKRIDAILESAFRGPSPEKAKMYNFLKQQRRIQTEFHVTLIHRASSAQFPDVWEHLTRMYEKASAPTPDRDYVLPDAPLGSSKVQIERLVWDDRLMAFVVRLSPSGAGAEPFQTINPVAHITVGTASNDIKPKESNDLLARWLELGSGNGIEELVLPGAVELEGTVRAVLPR